MKQTYNKGKNKVVVHYDDMDFSDLLLELSNNQNTQFAFNKSKKCIDVDINNTLVRLYKDGKWELIRNET
jgi:hypothetical protein